MTRKLGGIAVSALQERAMLNILNGLDEASLSIFVEEKFECQILNSELINPIDW